MGMLFKMVSYLTYTAFMCYTSYCIDKTGKSRIFSFLLLVGGLIYLKHAFDWEEKRIKEKIKRRL